MHLETVSFETRRYSFEELESLMRAVHRSIRKGGQIHCDEDRKLQSIYCKRLFSLSSLCILDATISSLSRLNISNPSAGYYAFLLESIAKLSLTPVLISFNLGANLESTLCWRKLGEGAGFGVGFSCNCRNPADRKQHFQGAIQHSTLRSLIQIVESSDGFWIEPQKDGLVIDYQISTGRNGKNVDPESWYVVGIETALTAAEQVMELANRYSASLFAEELSVRVSGEKFDSLIECIGSLADAWDVDYFGAMKSDSIEFLVGQSEFPGRVPLATWLDENRRDGGASRIQIDCIEGNELDGVSLEVVAMSETRMEAVRTLKKMLPKVLLREMPPVFT